MSNQNPSIIIRYSINGEDYPLDSLPVAIEAALAELPEGELVEVYEVAFKETGVSAFMQADEILAQISDQWADRVVDGENYDPVERISQDKLKHFQEAFKALIDLTFEDIVSYVPLTPKPKRITLTAEDAETYLQEKANSRLEE